jgi:hypothetical protein
VAKTGMMVTVEWMAMMTKVIKETVIVAVMTKVTMTKEIKMIPTTRMEIHLKEKRST